MAERLVKTQCARDCPDSCYMDVTVKDGVIVSVRGGRDNPFTAGFVCPRGAGDPRRVYSEGRVLYPRLREGPKPGSRFKRASWGDALTEVTRRLDEVLREGPERVLLLDYSGNSALITSQFATRLWSAIGATHTDHSICSLSGHEALKLHYGLTYGVAPETLPDRRSVTLWGHNTRVCSPHQWALIMKARERGAKVAVVDPRRSESAEAADLWLSPRPGTDVALVYGVARSLIEGDYADEGFIARHTTGYQSFREEALQWTPSRVESTTGVAWGEVEELARLMGEGKPGAVLMGIGFQKSAQGAESVRAVSLLPALLGEHRGFYYTNSRGRFIDYSLLSGEAQSGGGWRMVSQTGVGELLRRGEFGFVYVVGMNPALTLPDLGAVRDGLSRGDVYVAVHDTHMTETCDYADAVLPAPTFLEKEDFAPSDCHPYTRLSNRCVEPLGESRSEVLVMREMAKRLGRTEDWLFEEPRAALEVALRGAFEGGTPADLLGGADLRVRERSRMEYQTPSGKVEFYSTVAREPITPLPRQLPVEGGDFTLLNSALPQWTHSQFRDVYGEIPLTVWVNRDDAARLGIADGDPVTLSNEGGEIELRASVGDRVGPGVLWSPRPLVDHMGRAQNALVSGVPQALGGGPRYDSARVKITRVTNP
jgi:anaerobic selenocysteine-containing dehydrogenase